MLSEVFRDTISTGQLCLKSHRILVAVSGGKDSMALLHLFHSEGYEVEAAHVNFGLRGADADADEQLVFSFCREKQIPFHRHLAPTKKFASESGISTQMAARILRYNWFEELAGKHGLDKIATGHHLLDNLETVLFNFTKGTGPRGLTGIPVKTGRIIRPLLHASPEAILTYLQQNEIPWREDLSNHENHYHRNRIRNQVIPLLKIINPGLEDTFRVNLHRFYDLAALFEENMGRFTATHKEEHGATVIPEQAVLQTSPLVLEEFLKPFGFNYHQALNATKISETGKKIQSATHLLTRERGHWLLKKNTLVSPLADRLIPGEGQFEVGSCLLSVEQISAEGEIPDYSNPHIAWLDAEKVSWPLCMRPWKKADYFRPFGMKGRKAVSDYLKDQGLGTSEKQQQMVVEDASEILWVVGKRTAEPFRITPSTQKLLRLEIKKSGE